MITEYQASFLPPSKYTSSTLKLNNPQHPWVRDASITSVRRRHVPKQQTSPSPKAGRPPTKTDVTFAQRLSLTKVTQPLRVDYTTVYQNDFRAWKPEKSFPLKSSKSNEKTLPEKKRSSMDRRKAFVVKGRTPFEAITTYRVDYVPYPVQPKSSKVLPEDKGGKALPETPAAGQVRLGLFQRFRISLTDIENQNFPAVRKFHSTKLNRPTCQGLQQSLSTCQIYEKRTKPLRDGDRAAVGTETIDHKAKCAESIKKAVNMCSCDGMKNHHPDGQVGPPAFQCSSCMFWSVPQVGEMSRRLGSKT
ncbi:PREDICTED: uncharacterized protein LOC107086399 [Cyprinodon variegatus]|uniref:uncharacterized protein LOC107086399 n=1 Tax=Cyprinodon variegatus TaxID=28743 RepID=UPI000742B32D|nr:PREDICTED: uncharacterized protein LOC107086399 [Cyprinodon variegatus]